MKPLSVNIATLLLSISFLNAGCSDPHDKPLFSKDISGVYTADTLPPAERAALLHYSVRHALGPVTGEPPLDINVTIRQALDEEDNLVMADKQKEIAQAVLKVELAKKRALLQKQIDDAVSVVYLSKQIENLDKFGTMKAIFVTLGIQNKSSKDIAGIKGGAIFTDIFGERIIDITSSQNKTIKAGETVTLKMGVYLFDEAGKNLSTTEDSKLKFNFDTEQIVFTDGSKLIMPKDTN